MTTPTPEESPVRDPRPRWRQALLIAGIIVLIWFVAAYAVLPVGWMLFVHRHPDLTNLPDITHTKTGIPGDPLNVALIGTEDEVKKILLAAKWYPADPITFESCLKIAEATVLKRPYDDAPVSPLYWEGRREDLAFENPVGPDPRERNHVRFWKSTVTDTDGRPVWMGSATFDRRVGLSHTTGEITHHIGADVDVERDRLFTDLDKTGDLREDFFVDGFHKVLHGRNGGGDPWHTDGRLRVGVIRTE